MGDNCSVKASCNTRLSRKAQGLLGQHEGWALLQFTSVARSCPTLCDPMDCSTPGLPVHRQLPEFTQTHVHQVGDAIQPSRPLSSPSLCIFNLSQHRIFSRESVLHIRWPKYWSFSFRISPSNEYSGLISCGMDWLDLLAVQGTLEFSPIPQFKSIHSSGSSQSNSHIHT